MKRLLLTALIFLLIGKLAIAQEKPFAFSGQLSALHLSKIAKPWQSATGIRYIPDIQWNTSVTKEWKFDMEASVNGSLQLNATMPDSFAFAGRLKPYRIWGRMSTDRFGLRVGLQKISFGSAMMLRPLMWFDHIDPRDPLQLTDGVYAVLGRYFFQNNSNIWLWAILPGKTVKGWEYLKTNPKLPEFGGRIQVPAGKGEIALSGHYRSIGTAQNGSPLPVILEKPVPEYRLGLDGKWDIGPGVWFEGTYTYAPLPEPYPGHTRMLTLGTDYTFGLGNGLTAAAEQFFYQTGMSVFAKSSGMTFSALSLTYPVSLTHSLTGMVFYNWTANNWYRFINWSISLENVTFYLIAFWNPDTFDLYGNTGNTALMGGKGIEILFVWNH